MRLKKLAALLAAMALAGVLALSLTGCDKLPGVDAGVTGASQASDGRQTGGYALGKIGEKLTTQFFTFSVNSVEKADSCGDAVPGEGNTLVVAEITVKNTFGETIPMFSSDFALGYGEGDEDYCFPLEAAGDGLMELQYDLAKGEEITAKVAYEVPADADSFSLFYLEIYEDDFVGNAYYVDFEL